MYEVDGGGIEPVVTGLCMPEKFELPCDMAELTPGVWGVWGPPGC